MMKKFLWVALIAAIVASCCPCKRYQRLYGSKLEGTQWQMTQFEGRSFKTNDNYTLEFGLDGRLSGIGDCNRLMGGYTKDVDGTIKFNGLASTRMMCPNQKGEDAFIATLNNVDSFKLDGKLLMLFAKGEMLAIFEAQTQTPASASAPAQNAEAAK